MRARRCTAAKDVFWSLLFEHTHEIGGNAAFATPRAPRIGAHCSQEFLPSNAVGARAPGQNQFGCAHPRTQFATPEGGTNGTFFLFKNIVPRLRQDLSDRFAFLRDVYRVVYFQSFTTRTVQLTFCGLDLVANRFFCFLYPQSVQTLSPHSTHSKAILPVHRSGLKR